MKKNYFLHTAILLVALVCGTVPVWSQTYKKISSIDELTDGKYVIAYGEEYAMTNENAGKYFKHIAISPVDGAINTPDESIVWDIETTANGISIKNGGTYIGFNGTKNSATAYTEFTEKKCEFVVSFDEANQVFKLQNVADGNYYLQFNANKDQERFACYKGTQKDLTLYKSGDTRTDVKVVFNGIEGNKDAFLGKTTTFNSSATATPERPITYSSSNHEVATISQEGEVTLVGIGTTIIKATTESDETYQAGEAQYTLTVRNESAELPYSTDFKSGLGDWINYTLAGTTVWKSTTYGAQANGFGQGASEVYLVSPSVKAANIILAFSSEKGYTGNDLQLFYSTDFDPSSMSQPSDASWTEITDKATWATSQETTESGNIELNNLTAPIRFAFKYTCTADESARWTITNLSISANNSTGIEEATANEMKVINGKGQVTIETAEAMPIAIYALTGAQVRQIELVEGTNIVELPTGIYLIGNKKVVVF